jgi:hypothetical protein
MAQTLEEGCIKYVENEYEKRNATGWKIHLTVRPENHHLVYEYLQSIPYTSKYGQSDQTGKDFTIYIGSWDDMQHCAEDLEKKIGHMLESPTGNALYHDLVITPKVAARFDLRDPRFAQWGHKGISHFRKDVGFKMFEREKFKKDEQGYLRKFVERAYNTLNEKFGVYFSGSNQQLTKLIRAFLNGETV